MIVSQDPSMREAARLVPGTPILYLYGRAPTLEKPSDYSKSLVNEDAEQRFDLDPLCLKRRNKPT